MNNHIVYVFSLFLLCVDCLVARSFDGSQPAPFLQIRDPELLHGDLIHFFVWFPENAKDLPIYILAKKDAESPWKLAAISSPLHGGRSSLWHIYLRFDVLDKNKTPMFWTAIYGIKSWDLPPWYPNIALNRWNDPSLVDYWVDFQP